MNECTEVSQCRCSLKMETWPEALPGNWSLGRGWSGETLLQKCQGKIQQDGQKQEPTGPLGEMKCSSRISSRIKSLVSLHKRKIKEWVLSLVVNT